MVIEEKCYPQELDSEWMKLMSEAKALGLHIEDIRNYLNNSDLTLKKETC